MPIIEFLEDRVLQDEHRGTVKETRYKKGQRLTVSESSALHWTRRKAAKVVQTKKKTVASKGRSVKNVP